VPRAAFLTLEDRTGFVVDDGLAAAELTRRGWEVEELPWNRPADWSRFDAVVVRSTWDYQHAPAAFLAALEAIHASGARLFNPLEVIRWNLRKTYLRDLAAGGVAIVPTTFGRGLSAATLRDWVAAGGRRVLKPVVSANAHDTYPLEASTPGAVLESIAARYADREWMAQPFVRSVTEVGEYSLFYFGQRWSHAILKTPARGDFRVQEDHGGTIRPIAPPPDLRAAADAVLAAVHQPLLQARVDLVRLDDGTPALMELELIEPSLYFRTDPASPAHFADALEAALAG
jgi:glutathione synthase/RimK-type ligase-like ATP-grasp enzyme